MSRNISSSSINSRKVLLISMLEVAAVILKASWDFPVIAEWCKIKTTHMLYTTSASVSSSDGRTYGAEWGEWLTLV